MLTQQSVATNDEAKRTCMSAVMAMDEITQGVPLVFCK